MYERTELPPVLSHLRWIALLAGIAGLVVLVLLGMMRADLALKAYLFAFLLALGASLGSMGLLMLNHLSGGEWGFPIRRLAETAGLLLPLLLVLFVPIGATVALGSQVLFHWVGVTGEQAEALHLQTQWLNVQGFLIRAAVYFALWILLALLLSRFSRQRDENRDPAWSARLRRVSAPGLLIYFLTMSFAAVDWVMSRQPAWFSTIIGFLVIVGQGATAISLMIVLLAVLSKYEPFHGRLTRAHFHDLGNLLLTVVVVWSYMSFAQYLIIWSGNLSEFIPWYVTRREGLWLWVAIALIVFHFFVPFFILLSRWSKRRVAVVGTVAALVLAMRVVDVCWLVLPGVVSHAQHPAEPPAEQQAAMVQVASAGLVVPDHQPAMLAASAPQAQHGGDWTDYMEPLAVLAALVGVGGIWLSAYLMLLPRHPMLARRDPLEEPSPMEANHG